MYLQARQRRRGLGRLGSQAMPLSLANPVPNAPNCPWWLIFTGNYLTCTQQPQLQTEANAQIQQVADNAALYYSPDVAAIAQQAATAQESNTPLDVSFATQDVSNSQVLQSPLTYVGNALLNPNVAAQSPSSWPSWLWVALAIGGGLVVVSVLKK